MTAWSEWTTKLALGDQLPRPRECYTSDVGEACAFARSVGTPVVAKASGVAHKSEGGLVRLGLDEAGLRACFPDLASAGDGNVLVAEQVIDAELELIIGGIRDETFGPLVAIGLGGIAAELLDDAVFILSPSTPDEVDVAISQLAGSRLLQGIRGRQPVDRQALFEIVEAVGRLLDAHPEIVEVDCNPVMILHGHPLVVDALAVEALS